MTPIDPTDAQVLAQPCRHCGSAAGVPCQPPQLAAAPYHIARTSAAITAIVVERIGTRGMA